MSNNSKARFSNRVDDYVRYRPSYPKEIISFLQGNYDLTNKNRVADIGAGTGISAQLFLDAGFRVIGIEPNLEMREKAAALLQDQSLFSILDGSAESTGLDAGSVDIILCGQAFHWFDQQKAKMEFKRILKPGGIVLLLWNERLVNTDFEKRYEQLIIDHGRNYLKVDHRNIHLDDIRHFFSPGTVSLEVFGNFQLFDYSGVEGRLLSSSYMPSRSDEGSQAMIKDLKTLFDQFQVQGKVRINYDTKLFIGSF